MPTSNRPFSQDLGSPERERKNQGFCPVFAQKKKKKDFFWFLLTVEKKAYRPSGHPSSHSIKLFLMLLTLPSNKLGRLTITDATHQSNIGKEETVKTPSCNVRIVALHTSVSLDHLCLLLTQTLQLIKQNSLNCTKSFISLNPVRFIFSYFFSFGTVLESFLQL